MTSLTSEAVIAKFSPFKGYTPPIGGPVSPKILSQEIPHTIVIQLEDVLLHLSSAGAPQSDRPVQYLIANNLDNVISNDTNRTCILGTHPAWLASPACGNVKLVLKLGQGIIAYTRLLKEYELYRTQLAPLQRDVVPKCHDMFIDIQGGDPEVLFMSYPRLISGNCTSHRLCGF